MQKEIMKNKPICTFKGKCLSNQKNKCKKCKYNINIQPILQGECAG